MSSTSVVNAAPPDLATKPLRFRIIACGLFLILFQFWTIRAGMPLALAGAADFRMLYAAGTMVRTGDAARLYDFNYEQQVQQQVVGPSTTTLPYMYPLYAALPAAPLSLLPYRIAYLAMFALNLSLLLAASFAFRPYLPALTHLWPPLPAVVFLAFLPVGIALLQGQVSLLLLLLFCGAFAAIKRQRFFISGLWLSIALIKPHVVLPVILLFAIWRNWRLIAGFVTGALALCILSLPFAGTAGLATYARFMLNAASTGSLGAAQNKYDMFSGRMPNLHGLFVTLSGGAHWGTVLAIVSSIAVLIWTALQPPSLPRAIVASILVSYNLHPHDLSLLLIPICLIFDQTLARASQPEPPSQKPTHLEAISAATALLWMVSPFGLVLLGNGWNYLLAPAMLPFLFRRDPVPYTLDPRPYALPPGLKRSLPFYIFKRWFKPGDPILLFEHLHRTYGNIASYRLMQTNIVFVNHPDYIREILINQAPSFVKERTLNRMKILLGEGLITSDDPIHKRQRKIAAPAFHRQRIAAYADTIVASAAAHASRWRDGQTIDINAAMMDLSLEIIARTLFDLEVTPDIRSINDEVNAIMDIYNFLVAMPRLESWLHLPIPILNRFRRSRSRLNAIVDNIIRDHRASGVDKGDLLSMLIASRYEADEVSAVNDQGMSDEQIRDEVLTIFLAGYETVANALTWTWYCLSQNPAAATQLHAELDRVLRPNPYSLLPVPCTSRLPTLADYPSLPYTEQVFAESMRLYPPAWAMGRRSTKPIQLGRYNIPPGTHFFFSQYIMHRSEEYFPEPLRFDPTRHTSEAKAARQKFTYFPFGGGGRQCIGESFAWMEGVLALAAIASRWRMTYLGDAPPVPQAKITLRPRDPLLMRLEAR